MMCVRGCVCMLNPKRKFCSRKNKGVDDDDEVEKLKVQVSKIKKKLVFKCLNNLRN